MSPFPTNLQTALTNKHLCELAKFLTALTATLASWERALVILPTSDSTLCTAPLVQVLALLTAPLVHFSALLTAPENQWPILPKNPNSYSFIRALVPALI